MRKFLHVGDYDYLAIVALTDTDAVKLTDESDKYPVYARPLDDGYEIEWPASANRKRKRITLDSAQLANVLLIATILARHANLTAPPNFFELAMETDSND